MEAEIIKKDNKSLKIAWSDPKIGFGQLSMVWDQKKGRHIVDSEYLGIDTIIKIFKAI